MSSLVSCLDQLIKRLVHFPLPLGSNMSLYRKGRLMKNPLLSCYKHFLIAAFWMNGILTRCPGKAMEGSWVIPILDNAWAAHLLPLSVPSNASPTKALDPPCCTTKPRNSVNLQTALRTRAINSWMFLLSFLAKATKADVIPHSARVWNSSKQKLAPFPTHVISWILIKCRSNNSLCKHL